MTEPDKHVPPVPEEPLSSAPYVVDAAAPTEPQPEPPAPAPQPLQNPLAHLLAGLGTVASRPRVMLFLLSVSILLALPVALPVYQSAAEHVAPAAGFPGAVGEFQTVSESLEMVSSAPMWLFEDWNRRDPGLHDAVANTIAPLLLLASLFGLFVSAGWMHLAVRGGREHSLMSFCKGGGDHFWAFMRTWIVGLGMFWAATWLVWSAPGEWVMHKLFPDGETIFAQSEKTVVMVENVRVIVYTLLLFWVEIVLDIARASIVAGHRRSALLAILRGMGFLLREPVRVLLLVGGGLGVELVFIAGVVALVEKFGWPMWLLVIALPIGRIALRGARHGGLASMYAESKRSRPGPTDTRRGKSFDDGTAWRTSAETEIAGG